MMSFKGDKSGTGIVEGPPGPPGPPGTTIRLLLRGSEKWGEIV